MTIRKKTAFVLVLLFGLGMSCHEDFPTEANDPTEQIFSRQSTWHLDSLAKIEPFFYLSAIWTSGPSDIYAAGTTLLHFNGSSWNFVPMHSSVGGPIGTSFGLSDVYGFSPANVYVAGSALLSSTFWPLIVHFDGNDWKLVSLPPTPPVQLMRIWGSSPTSIWAGGDRGLILHYDGKSWTQEELLFQPKSGDSWHISDFAGVEGSNPYALIFLTNSTTPYEAMYLIKRIDQKWDLVDSLSTTLNRCRRLYVSPSNTLYSAGRHLGRWNGTEWEILRKGTDSRSIFQVAANLDSNLFIVGGSVFGGSGFVEHYNGTDWVVLASSLSSGVSFSDASTSGATIAALGWDPNYFRYVLRSQPQ